MSDELPNGWVWAEMREVCSNVQDGTHFSPKNQSPVGDYKYITAKNIKTHGIDLSNVTYISEKVHRPIYERCNPEQGDVLYIKDGATTGIATVNDLDEEFSLLSSVALLKPRKSVLNAHYLKWYLNSPSGFKAMTDQMTGSAIARLVLRTIRKSSVPVAPLAEQRRIVAKLETLLGKVDASQQRLAKIPVLLKRFRQSVLAAACSGRLTADWREEKTTYYTDDTGSVEDLPDGWRTTPLSEFIESSFYGPRFGKESYADEGVPTIRTTDMGFDGSIVLTDAPRINLSPEELEKYCLQHGDLVVTRTGATIGKCAIYDKSRGPAIPGAYLIRFRFKQDLVAPKYILRFFMSPAGQNLLIGGSNAVAQPNVNATTISQFVIPVPPLPEQQEIVRRVEGLFVLADQLELRLAKARGQVDKLTPSLLARAFAGKLVPQDPTDEPAEKMLERIHVQSESKSHRDARR